MSIHLIASDVICTATAEAVAFGARAGLRAEQMTTDVLLDEHTMLRLLEGRGEELIRRYWDVVDYLVALLIAYDGQTFLFDAQQMLAFARAVDRRLPPGDHMAPFMNVIVQFTDPIPEQELLGIGPVEHGERSADMAGLLIRFPLEGQDPFVHVFAWFAGGGLARVSIPVAGDGALSDFHQGPDVRPVVLRYKQRLANLALLCLAYLTSPGIEVELIQAPPPVARRREREGKPPLPDYYVCRLAKGRRYASDGEPTGKHVSFRFDVVGHFRRLPDGRTVWVRPHQRGLAHVTYKPKVYQVE